MDAMQEHYQLSDENYQSLIDSGVTFKNFYDSVRIFDKIGSNQPITKINLFYYVDEKGDFNKRPFFPHKLIAQKLFDQLDIRSKIELAEYIDYIENGEY